MKKTAVLMLSILMLALVCVCAQAAESINLYVHEYTMKLHSIGDGRVLAYPADEVRITRASLYPWDESETQFSLFVEIQNISDAPIYLDGGNTLYACDSARVEFDKTSSVFTMTGNTILPGERVVLMAGVYPYEDLYMREGEVINRVVHEGLAHFDSQIRRAQYVQVRLTTPDDGEEKPWPAADTATKAWIEDGVLYLEAVNNTDRTQRFASLGVVVSERNGRITEVMRQTEETGAVIAPGETILLQKTLPSYFTQAMIDGATYKTFAYEKAE